MNKTQFPTFSLITVTLNNLSGLKNTCESIEKQSFTDFEWIIVDGASTDGSLEFLKEKRSAYRKNQKDLKIISEPDQGIYDAMNTGISHARGHYLLFLNAGDILAAAETLALLKPHTEKKPDFIYGDALEPKENESSPLYKHARRYKEIMWGMITHHQAMLYRRHTIRDHKLHYSLLYKIASDYDFTIRFLQHAKKTIYIPQPICLFEQGGVSQQMAFLGRKEQYIIREKLNLVPQPQNLWIFIVQSLSYHLRKMSPRLYDILKRLIRRTAK